MAFLGGLLGNILEPVLGIIDKTITDKDEREKIRAELMTQALSAESDLNKAAASVIQQEAASKHWLAANWRPLTALIFVGLIVARWLGYTAENMSEAEYLSVYGLVKIMIGGYVTSRGVEKVLPGVISALKK